MKQYLIAGLLATFSATSVSAATDLTSASVTGPSGTVWNTDSSDDFFALFLQRPIGTLINPTDNFVSTPTTLGANNFAIAGEGFPGGGSENSDLLYTLTLMFADGATISGQYVDSIFTGGSSSTMGGTTYTLTGFGWDRSPADNVSAFQAVSGGDPADYSGQFSYNAVDAVAAVPEASTWLMMILGFGMVGFGMRFTKSRSGKENQFRVSSVTYGTA